MLIPVPVGEVMTEDVETVSPTATAAEVAGRFVESGIGSLVVVDNGIPAGIVTDADLVGIMADGNDPAAIPVESFMSAPVITVDRATTLETAAETMRENGITRLPVTDGDELVGIVTATDISFFLPLLRVGRHLGGGRGAEFEGGETIYEADDWEFEYVDGGRPGIGVGDCVRFRKHLNDADVERFALASGDTNRLHLDDEFARATRFGERIVHGTLVAGLISAALARIPGLTIYLSQDLSFLKPVSIGSAVTVVCEVIEDLGRDRYRLTTQVYDEADEFVIDGEATVLIDPLPEGYERPTRDRRPATGDR